MHWIASRMSLFRACDRRKFELYQQHLSCIMEEDTKYRSELPKTFFGISNESSAILDMLIQK